MEESAPFEQTSPPTTENVNAQHNQRRTNQNNNAANFNSTGRPNRQNNGSYLVSSTPTDFEG